MFDRYLLAAEIHRKGYTQAEIARIIGIYPSTMSKKMRTGNFKAAEIYKLIEALEIAHPETIFFAREVAEKATEEAT